MKKGFNQNIEKATLDNTNFRKVLYTGIYSQLVLMSLNPNEDIGMEVHEDTDQFFRFESGEGEVVINETTYEVHDGDAIIVPAGAQHNIINKSTIEPLKLYTIYSPSHHKDGTLHVTKEQAMSADEEFDGITTE